MGLAVEPFPLTVDMLLDHGDIPSAKPAQTALHAEIAAHGRIATAVDGIAFALLDFVEGKGPAQNDRARVPDGIGRGDSPAGRAEKRGGYSYSSMGGQAQKILRSP